MNTIPDKIYDEIDSYFESVGEYFADRRDDGYNDSCIHDVEFLSDDGHYFITGVCDVNVRAEDDDCYGVYHVFDGIQSVDLTCALYDDDGEETGQCPVDYKKIQSIYY